MNIDVIFKKLINDGKYISCLKLMNDFKGGDLLDEDYYQIQSLLVKFISLLQERFEQIGEKKLSKLCQAAGILRENGCYDLANQTEDRILKFLEGIEEKPKLDRLPPLNEIKKFIDYKKKLQKQRKVKNFKADDPIAKGFVEDEIVYTDKTTGVGYTVRDFDNMKIIVNLETMDKDLISRLVTELKPLKPSDFLPNSSLVSAKLRRIS